MQLYIVNNTRRSFQWLSHNGLTADMPGVYPLRDSRPWFDPLTHQLVDLGTGGSAEEGYYIDWIVEPLNDAELAANLPLAQAAKAAEILAGANAASAAVKTRYSQPEIDSWPLQETEARALLADPDAPAPLVRALAENIGVTAEEFARRIVNNADLAAIATKAIILQQQAMEKAAKEAESVAAVLAITVNYTLEA